MCQVLLVLLANHQTPRKTFCMEIFIVSEKLAQTTHFLTAPQDLFFPAALFQLIVPPLFQSANLRISQSKLSHPTTW